MNTSQKYGWAVALVIAIVALFAGLSGGDTTIQQVPAQSSSNESLRGSTDDNWTVGKDLIVNGTTTISKSFDGFIVRAAATVATTSIAASVQNTAGPAVCDGGSGAIFANAAASDHAPALQVSWGTSTVAGTFATNLIGSTTLATSTDKTIGSPNSAFLWAPQEFINMGLSDGQGNDNNQASSTDFGNWSIEFGIHCWTLGG